MSIRDFARTIRDEMPLQNRLLDWVESPADWMEAFSAILFWIYGVLLLLPPATFQMTPSYRVMAFIAPEEIWGGAFIVVALLHSLSLCIGFRRLRVPACMLGAFVWIFVGVTFALSQNLIGFAPWMGMTLGVFVTMAGVKNARSRV